MNSGCMMGLDTPLKSFTVPDKREKDGSNSDLLMGLAIQEPFYLMPNNLN